MTDSVEIASRVVQLLETGQRESTYKQAAMMALIDISVENECAADGTLAIPITEVVHRIVAYYWPQVRTFHDEGAPSQVKYGRSIVDRIAEAKLRLRGDRILTPEAAREAQHPTYERLIKGLRQPVSQYPPTHLQNVRSAKGHADDFLFDAAGFAKKMRASAVDEIGQIVLRPGVPTALRRTAPLLRAFVRSLWVQDVVRFNANRLDSEDLDGFLFGADRSALHAALAVPLFDIQNGLCFYCGRRMMEVHVDHVLPWLMIPIDGVANLVAADQRCNLGKSASIPVRDHVDRALARDYLVEIAAQASVPVLFSRAESAANGIFKSLSPSSLLWRACGEYERAQRSQSKTVESS